MGKLILKCMYKGKGIRTTENEKIWKKIIGKITLVGLNAYYKSAAIKTLWVDKERHMQISGTEYKVQKQTHTNMAN